MQYTQGEIRSQEEDIGKDHIGEEGDKSRGGYKGIAYSSLDNLV